ncbi:MAG: M14 family metallopeptidase [Planctomycetota bacterium]
MSNACDSAKFSSRGALATTGWAICVSLWGALATAETPPSAGNSRPPTAPEVREPRVRIAWNRYYDYSDIESHMRSLALAFPSLARLESIGKSEEGRDLWLLTIAGNAGTTPLADRPAMWVDANVHGNEVQGAEVCLYLASYLLENYGELARITELLNRVTFYLVPMVNPDGRAWWFQAPNTSSSSRSGKRPTDNDRDGLLDEDGPDDIDGDGELLQMRVRDPDGGWKTSPDDPRLMVRVKPGERGEWRLIGMEGIDNDADGNVNEDGPGGYDMNRNWPSVWMPNYVQSGAGEYPFSYPETRVVGDFILAHPNIAGVQSFHNSGGMILRGPGAESFGAYPAADVRVYDEIGKRGEEMLPYYRYMIIWKDLYTVYGGFVNWTYEQLGIFSFTNELWNDEQYHQERAAEPSRIGEEGEPPSRPTGAADPRHRFNDQLRSGVDYVPWKPFRHPVYGDIELGGWRKMSSRVAPSFMIEEMLHRNALFTLYHAEQIPELYFADVTTAQEPDGRTRIDVIVKNRRAIPSVAAHARTHRIGQPDLLEFESATVQVSFAGEVARRYPDELRPVRYRPERILNWRGVELESVYHVRYLVTGQGPFRLRYRSLKAGVVDYSGQLK